MFEIADRSEADRVLSVLTVGFTADPFMRWLYPEPATYLAHFPRVLNFFGGSAFERGSAYRSRDFSAAALWLPPGIHPDEEQLLACFEQTVAQDKHAELFATFEQMDKLHPVEPCWHLAFIASDPALRGKGVGSALLAACLKVCDEDGHPTYLESSNPANLPLYKRFGFEQTGLTESVSAPPIITMLRRPVPFAP